MLSSSAIHRLSPLVFRPSSLLAHFPFSFFLFLLFPFLSLAGNEVTSARVCGEDVEVSTTLSVQDNKFNVMQSQPTAWQDIFTNHSNTARVWLAIDHAAQQIPSSEVDVTVTLSVTSWDEDLAQTTETGIQLNVIWDPLTSATPDRHIFIPAKGMRVNVTVTGIYDNIAEQSLTALPAILCLEAETETERFYHLDVSHIIPQNAVLHTHLSPSGQLEVAWPYIEGAEEYDVEWAYVNDYGSEPGHIVNDVLPLSDLNFTFHNSATRITTPFNHCHIPLVFERGYLVYRVRPVGRGGDGFTQRIPGSWSSEAFPVGTDGLHPLADFPHRYALTPHHGDAINWQMVSSFAEQGKRKDVLTYYDGSSRNRQAVTRISSTGDIIVGETVYDHMGRPAISILPVPSGQEALAFHPDFNTVGTTPLNWEHFDHTSNYDAPPQLNTASGAALYYGEDTGAEGIEALIPQAHGRPYTQTVLMPDNTGRPLAVGGAGPDHAIGSGHETLHFYGKPQQGRLDRLFGTEVGYAEHYRENMTVDPNGQVTITFTDMAGRTIATSLAGESPATMEQLRNYNVDPSHEDWGTPLATAEVIDLDLLTGDNQLSPDGRTLSHLSTLLRPEEGQPVFQYTMQAQSFTPCSLSTSCYDIVYDLSIRLTDIHGNIMDDIADNPINYSPQLPDVSDSEDLDSICNLTAGFDTDNDLGGGQVFTAQLPLGQYRLSKELSVNMEALDFYADHYIQDAIAAGCLEPFEAFVDSIPCDSWAQGECDACIDTLDAYFMAEDLCDGCADVTAWLYDLGNFTGTAQQDSLIAIYQADSIACTRLCPDDLPPSICEVTYIQMLGDMTPSGQYAKYTYDDGTFTATDPLSWLNGENVLPKREIDPVFNFTSFSFTDSQGNPFSATSVEEMVNGWDPAFSHQVVHLHPEYCYYEGWCLSETHPVMPDSDEGNITSDEFDHFLRGLSFAQVDAGANGLSTEDILDPFNGQSFQFPADPFPTGPELSECFDPFFDDRQCGISSGVHWDCIATQMQLRLNRYMTVGGAPVSMWKAAAMAVHCPGVFSDDIADVNTCLAATGHWSTYPPTNEFEFIHDEATWVMFRNFYLSEKQKLQERDMNRFARDEGGCYSGCVGAENSFFDMFIHDMVDFSSSATQTESPFFFWEIAPDEVYMQPCSFLTFFHYLGRTRRFGNTFPFGTTGWDRIALTGNGIPDFIPAAQEEEQNQDYFDEMELRSDHQVWLSTGKCPMALDLELLLNALASRPSSDITDPAALQSIGAFTLELYEDALAQVCPACTTGTFHPLDYEVTSTTTDLEAVITDGSGTCDLILTHPGGTWHWDRIRSVQDIAFTGGSSNFTVNVRYDHDNDPVTPLQTHSITGTTCLTLGGCEESFIICQPTEHALSWLNMLNYAAHMDILDADAPDFPLPDDPVNDDFYAGTITQPFDVFLGGAPYTWEGVEGSPSSTLTLANGNGTLTMEIGSTSSVLGVDFSRTDYIILAFTDIRPDPDGGPGDFILTVLVDTETNPANGHLAQYQHPNGTPSIEVHTWTGHMSIDTGTEEDFPVGTCDEPVPLFCQTPAHDNLRDLDGLLNAFIHDGGVAMDTCWPTSDEAYPLTQQPAFTPALRNSPPLGGGVGGGVSIWRPADSLASNHRIFSIGHLITDERDTIPACELSFTLSTCNGYTDCDDAFASITHITDLEATAPVGFDGNYYGFRAKAWDGSTLIATLYGESCYPIANCSTCDPGPNLLQCMRYHAQLAQPIWFGDGHFSSCDTASVYCETYSGTDILMACPAEWDCDSVSVSVHGGQAYGGNWINAAYVVVSEHGTIVMNGYQQVILQTPDTSLDVLSAWNPCDFLTPTDLHAAYPQGAGQWATVLTTEVTDVLPNTLYTFSISIQNMGMGDPGPDDVFFVLIDGDTIGSFLFTDPVLGTAWPPVGQWQTYTVSWQSDGSYSPLEDYDLSVVAEVGDYVLGLSDWYFGEGCTISPPPVPLDTVITIADPCDLPSYQSLLTGANAQAAYDAYLLDARDDFRQQYIEHAMATVEETLTMTDTLREGHYTLYYYDLAGNLVKTVPPKGVHPLTDPQDLADVVSQRNSPSASGGGGAGGGVVPNHTFETQYTYNSLNQVVRSTTPDTRTSQYPFHDDNGDFVPDHMARTWYDRLGRPALSQSPQQHQDGRLTYTRYDHLGRVIATGEIEGTFTDPDDLPIDTLRKRMDRQSFPFNMGSGLTLREVTGTTYDLPFDTSIPLTQQNLRGRVAAVTHIDFTEAPFTHTTHYSYDIHGNVKTLLHQIPDLAPVQQYFRIDYEYDLVSGNVKQVTAPGIAHRYAYDADNRITNVWTAELPSWQGGAGGGHIGGGNVVGGVMWHQDSKYFYYPHGPLARTELGHHKVQGIDHAYTLQGWLKAVNANTLHPDNDMAQDGGTDSPPLGGGAGGGVHGNIARDAFAYSLHYHDGDYTPKAGTNAPVFLADASGSALASASQPLFNGNISRMVTSVSNFTVSPILGSAFRYDQLNRLVKAVHYDNLTDNEWGATAHSVEKNSDHYSAYFYDANGNIKRLERNAHGANVHMDRMTYTYPEHSNRLTIVNDSVPDQTGIMDTDFDDMSEDFQYDLDGRLTVDPSAQIAHIDWNAQGKVRFIGREEGSDKDLLVFHYDGMGNRVRKVVVPRNSSGETLPLPEWTFTYYVRDAQGNMLTTLERKFSEIDTEEGWDELHIQETMLYGSDRLGVRSWQKSEDTHPSSLIAKRKFTHDGLDDHQDIPTADDYVGSVITSTAPANYARHLEGTKRYELKNHLGNVLATVSDKRDVVDDDGDVLYYQPKVDNVSFYYPFGSLMPGLSDLGGEHRFGFQGQEEDDEIKGNGNSVNYKYRIHDPRIGRFLSLDPLAKDYPWNSPYAFSENRVIDGIELEGLEYLSKEKALFRMYMGYPVLQVENMNGISQKNLSNNGFVNMTYYNAATGELKGHPVLSQQPFLSNNEMPEIDNDEIAERVGIEGKMKKKQQKKLGKKGKRLVRDGVATSTPAGRGAGVGIVMLVNAFNYLGTLYQNHMIGEDRKELDFQLRTFSYVPSSNSWWDNTRMTNYSLMTKAYNDITKAREVGYVSDEFMQDVSKVSSLMNVIIFGGDGSESAEIRDIGERINCEINCTAQ